MSRIHLFILTYCVILSTVWGFVPLHSCGKCRLATTTARRSSSNELDLDPEVKSSSESLDPQVSTLQNELLELASSTKRGFSASDAQKKRARELIFDLARFNPTPEPLSPYYESNNTSQQKGPSLAGKWTLIFTDAPDITGLDAGGPLATAKLGRIGQECDPPYIKNVIEWKRPDWASSLPLSGNEDSRVLQKVVTEGSASPEKPFMMNLKLVGIELEGESSDDSGPAAFLRNNPVKLSGPLTAPFGQFELLYLDDTMRAIKTGQNFVAVNVRGDEEWF